MAFDAVLLENRANLPGEIHLVFGAALVVREPDQSDSNGNEFFHSDASLIIESDSVFF